jgi:hypothetical protein
MGSSALVERHPAINERHLFQTVPPWVDSRQIPCLPPDQHHPDLVLVPTQYPEGLRIQNQRFDVTGSLTGHRQWKKGVSFFMIDCGSGLKRGRRAIGDEQKTGTADGFYHTPPGRQIARIIGTVTAKGFSQNWNPGRVQCCRILSLSF